MMANAFLRIVQNNKYSVYRNSDISSRNEKCQSIMLLCRRKANTNKDHPRHALFKQTLQLTYTIHYIFKRTTIKPRSNFNK